ncbi:hypothetical protein [Treponema sp. R6D11]
MKNKVGLFVFLGVVVLCSIAYGAYALGARNNSQESQTPMPSETAPVVASETPVPADNASKAITGAEVKKFLNEFQIAKGLLFSRTNSDRDIIENIVYYKGSPISYAKINEYAKAYFNKIFTDKEIENLANVVVKNSMEETEEGGVIAIKNKKQIVLEGYGDNGRIVKINSIKMISGDTAKIICAEENIGGDAGNETYTVKFGRNAGNLYFISIK